MAETEMASRQSAGFLCIILEVSLHVLIRIVADNLAGVLVGADGTVRAETPELAGDDALACRDDVFAHGQGSVGHIVIDADGEVILALTLHVVVNSFELSGGRIFGRKAVSASEESNAGSSAFRNC